MSTPNEKLAEALRVLYAQQKQGKRILKSEDFSRTYRERLIQNGFLKDACKGWLYLTNPNSRPGDTTPWMASFWEFCTAYCNDRFGDEWHVNPEQSLLLAGESTIIPDQLIVQSIRGANNNLALPYDKSIFDLKARQATDPKDVRVLNGIRALTVPAALMKVSDRFFQQHPLESQLALAQIRTPTEVLRPLLDAGASTVAGRLAGAFRHIQKEKFADEIVRVMGTVGYEVREANPFEANHSPVLLRSRSPIEGRLAGLWQNGRDAVLSEFPQAPGLPVKIEDYLDQIDGLYQQDAYHSLSIEGYSVTEELIERVRNGDWDPNSSEKDKGSRDALAARGYWEAFQQVKNSVSKIIQGGDAAAIVEEDHGIWYRALFEPSVNAGLTKPADLAGYRDQPVFLMGSQYVPPRAESVLDAMTMLFELIRDEPVPSVKAVLGHWLFGYIHPYPDGNGRTGRFLLNALLASGGYPWTIIRLQDRSRYLEALDAASLHQNAAPFSKFIAERVSDTLGNKPKPESRSYTTEEPNF